MMMDWQSETVDSNTAGTAQLSSAGRASTATLPFRSGMPVVVVQKFDAIAMPEKQAAMLDGLNRKLRDALA